MRNSKDANGGEKIVTKEMSENIREILNDIYDSISVSLPIQKKKVGSVEVILNSIRKAYDEIIIKKNRKYLWKGPDFHTNVMRDQYIELNQTLEYKFLKSEQERHGRDFLDQIFLAAIQLGIDQGIQIERIQNDKTMKEIHAKTLNAREMLLSKNVTKADLDMIRFEVEGIYKELAMHYNKRK